MKPEISKKILGRMLSRETTELVIKDIAVEFTTFMRHECVISSDEGIFFEADVWKEEDLYDYWINNIYKPKEND